MYLKLVDKNWRGTYPEDRQDVTYAVGEVTTAPDCDRRPVGADGLYYTAFLMDYMPTIDEGHLLEVEPIGLSVRTCAYAPKSQSVRVLREITTVPTPVEEVDCDARYRIAMYIPANFLPKALPPACEEPDVYVRRWIAQRIPDNRLPDRIPTQAEEPDGCVRTLIAARIPETQLPDHIPTPAEEADAELRYWIAKRIPFERLPKRTPTRAEEPNSYVREWIAARITQGR